MGTGTGSIDLSTLNNLHTNLTQHFWFNSDAGATYGTGVHMTLSSQAEFIANPTGQNILMNTDGISIRNGTIPLMVLDNDSLDFNVVTDLAQGTYHNVANFGTSVRIGRAESSHVSVESNRIVAEDGVDDGMYGVKYFEVGLTEDNIMSMTQSWTVSEQVTGRIFELSYYPVNLNSVKVNGSTPPFQWSVDNPKQIYIPSTLGIGDEVEISYTTYGANSFFTFGQRLPGAKIGDTSFASGNNVVASGRAAHAEGIQTVASAPASHAEGYKTTARYSYAHAEGANTTAKDYATHAEGQNTTAFGYGAHSEGQNTTADFESAHAEGKGTYAGYGSGAHAEGAGTTAKGIASHAEGKGTIAREGSHVEGSYNIEDTSDEYAHIIGNGTSDDDRSNAFAVDWDGNTKVQGNYYANCSPNSAGTAYIGQVFNWQGNLKSNLTANADAYVNGGTINLVGGHTYLIIAQLSLTNSTSGTNVRRVQIYNVTAGASVMTQSMTVAHEWWGTLEAITTFQTTGNTTLQVRGSSSRPTTTIPTAFIRAVCIT